MIVNVIRDILVPAALLLPEMDSPKARMLQIVIGLQESRFEHRRQIGGPARGFWQFEEGGGVRGVLLHKASAYDAVKVCHERGVGSSVREVYERLEHDDILAACFARLLLWTDPRPLPLVGDVDGAWEYYIRTWRPGKPHRHTWEDLYDLGYNMLTGANAP
jgi:hypothetical protein